MGGKTVYKMFVNLSGGADTPWRAHLGLDTESDVQTTVDQILQGIEAVDALFCYESQC